MRVRFQFKDRSQVDIEMPQHPQQGHFISIDGISYQILRIRHLAITDQHKETIVDSVVCTCAFGKSDQARSPPNMREHSKYKG